MIDTTRMSTKELEELLYATDDGEVIDDIYDELENRERAMELMDWTEQDRRAAAEERLQLYMDEY